MADTPAERPAPPPPPAAASGFVVSPPKVPPPLYSSPSSDGGAARVSPPCLTAPCGNAALVTSAGALNVGAVERDGSARPNAAGTTRAERDRARLRSSRDVRWQMQVTSRHAPSRWAGGGPFFLLFCSALRARCVK
jgi:hypothetical protein